MLGSGVEVKGRQQTEKAWQQEWKLDDHTVSILRKQRTGSRARLQTRESSSRKALTLNVLAPSYTAPPSGDLLFKHEAVGNNSYSNKVVLH